MRKRFLLLAAVFSLVTIFATSAFAGVQDFKFTSFEADYYLSRDANNRSTMQVREELVAEFPNFAQNHGIERAIPNDYDGHELSLSVESVTNKANKALPYSTYESSNHTVLRIGDANAYVMGQQTYVIKYSLRDVTKNFEANDEIFWNTTGLQWKQPFDSVTGRLHLDDSIKPSFNNQTRCFTGFEGSTSEDCEINVAGSTITFTATNLLPHQNLSIVAGFNAGTFAKYEPSMWQKIWAIAVKVWIILAVIAPIAVTIWLVRIWRRYGKAPAGKGVIVPEYLPPKDLSAIWSANVVKKGQTGVTAQILDLAVRHYIKIYESETKKFLSKSKKYELELVKDPTDLRAEEKELVNILFSGTKIGSRRDLSKADMNLAKKMMAYNKQLPKSMQAAGYYQDRASTRKRYYWISGGLLVLSFITFNPGLFVAGIAALIVVALLMPLSEQGVTTRDYLFGLRDYMKLAEAERLKALQSPEGAQKTGVNLGDGNEQQLLHLYERVLPYAVIFGIEKEWLKELGVLYENSSAPEWYSGSYSGFNAAVFASSVSSFTATSTTNYAPSSSSSSSGFSGGGSSGGGGGGGGGGGW